MSVTLEIQLEKLKQPAVAEAMAKLMLALGNVSGYAQYASAAAPAVAAPAPAPRPQLQPQPQPQKSPVAAAIAASPPAFVAPPAPQSTAPDSDLSESERYAAFVEELPERSRRFLELVKSRGVLKIKDAMDQLGIKVPKAMGGITGSIGRWAPVRGVPIPYEAIKVNGERAWRWLGAPGEAGAPRGSRSAAASRRDEGSDDDGDSHPARPGVDERFIAALPESSRKFMTTLRERGQLTMAEVLELFHLARANAVVGITEPIQRLGQQQGIVEPFVATAAANGDRVYRWPGFRAEAPASASGIAGGARDAGRAAAKPGVRVRKRA